MMGDGIAAYRRIDFLETQERSKTLKNECDQDIHRDVVEKDKLIDTLNIEICRLVKKNKDHESLIESQR